MSIKRYFMYGVSEIDPSSSYASEESDDGDWVRFEDVAQLQQRIAELEAALEAAAMIALKQAAAACDGNARGDGDEAYDSGCRDCATLVRSIQFQSNGGQK